MVFLFWAAGAAAACAHPHVFIVQRLAAAFDEKGLARIEVRWKFDDMFSGMIAMDHDIDGDGALSPAEVAVVREKAFSNLSEFSYFTFIKINDRPFDVKTVSDFNAILKDGRLTYVFSIPCRVGALDRYQKVTVATYDPSYYSAIFFAENEPVSLIAADACEVKAAVREDADTKIYFDMIHPWALFLEFRRKP